MEQKFILTSLIVFLLIVYSCNNNFSEKDTSVVETKSFLTEEAQEFKEILLEKLPILSKLSEGESSRVISTDNSDPKVKELMESLSRPVIDMLKSQGFTANDWSEYKDINDPEFILAGMLYLAMYETNSGHSGIPLLKTRSLESGDDGTCWSKDRIIACIGTAIGLDAIYELLTGVGCITKTVAWSIVKTVAKRALGAAGVVIFMIEFGQCMGWS